MDANQVIDALGGTAAVAKLCKIKASSVSEWRHKCIPPARLMFLELARPDVDWAYLRGTQPASPGASPETPPDAGR